MGLRKCTSIKYVIARKLSIFFIFFFSGNRAGSSCDRSVGLGLQTSDYEVQGSNCAGDGIQGPVVQSIVSLTSSLRVISLTVLADSIYNMLIFFAEKKLLTFFQQKISVYLRIARC